MSLSIDINDITRVMVGGEWHDIFPGSFDIDSYEYVEQAGGDIGTVVLHHGGASGVCATGFTFVTAFGGAHIAGPMTAIQAVEFK